ncbi:MAG: sulfotransferase [Pseudomonadota bacterium]
MTTAISASLQSAVRALNAANWPELKRLCESVLQQDARQSEAWFLLSVAAAAERKPSTALTLVGRALALQPDNAEYLAQQARYHTQLHQHAAALAAADRALALQPQRPLLLDTLGVVYSKLGEQAKAAMALRAAVQLAPTNAQYHFNLGSVEQFLGNAEAARLCYEQALALKPDFCRAYWALSELEKNAGNSGLLARMLELQSKPGIGTEDMLYLSHAIAREYEKLGDAAQAFAQLERGKQQRKQQVHYTGSSDAALFDAMRNAFPLSSSAVASNPSANDSGSNAIFIVGMPRSGTTLVERMLASHSQVISLGELQELPLAVKRVAKTASPVVLDTATITAACAADVAAIGDQYLQRLKDRVPADKRFIDKMPLNFLYVGFILEALPAAKVVCLRRNPLDTILSNYRQLFALDFSYYNYHYDLADTARYYVLFHRLMNHWQQRYGDRFHEVHYEQLTATPEPVLRHLLNHLKLPWEADCLAFHDNPTASTTASSIQIRQPLYTSAVGRWRKYGELLQPARAVLDNEGIAWDH